MNALFALTALVVFAPYVLSGCGTSGTATRFGSPERLAALAQCLPYALPAAAKDAKAIAQADQVNAADVLAAVGDKVAAGDAERAATACGPYILLLAAAGNQDAVALKAKMEVNR